MADRAKRILVDSGDPIPAIVESAVAQLIGQGATDANISCVQHMFAAYLEWRNDTEKEPMPDCLEALGALFASVVRDFIGRNERIHENQREAAATLLLDTMFETLKTIEMYFDD